ncbi:M20/M25/M40 family metallo-hydrolase [Salipaludibacillus sp. CF4.18]|uniref:M20/M25/M40 family metallo-hydrolase n=1 Tax=Salipaludibacillus sp. CF4.18 TaxID=3373081 RepID=UPI003EE63B7D
MKFSTLFIRQGFNVSEREENVFDCGYESEENIAFLMKTLDAGNVSYDCNGFLLNLKDSEFAEKEWLTLLDVRGRGRTELVDTQPWKTRLRIEKLDLYISGIVNELIRLGLYTGFSCDGHGVRAASVYLLHEDDLETASELLLACGIEKVRTNGKELKLHVTHISKLLDVAEKLHQIKKEWLTEGLEFVEKHLFQAKLEDVLSINGVSGEEERIRQYVKEELTNLVDHMEVDVKGNILAQRSYRSGNGPTVLLNAHLDTVEELVEGREIIKNGPIWSSSEGILGADDRAGVSILLEMAKWLDGSSFNGKVKFIFTVEEEIGLVGARSLEESFLWDVDAAIVVDRRNTTDIVVSCGGYIPFCHENYGTFFESIAEAHGLGTWKSVAGGSSDTRIWAEHGIQSVNLSAGYSHEHTDDEILDVEACFNTLKLIQAVFTERIELRKVLTRITHLNQRSGRAPGEVG